MTDVQVDRHYGRGDLLEVILEALDAAGKDLDHLTLNDLAPVDEFHVRGRAATEELATLAELGPGVRLLDVGCGLGGSTRYLSSRHGCEATGVDLTREYVEVARALGERVGLGHLEYRHASALELPFADGSFDIVWTEHVQMNIADKRGFYTEAGRVLAPGGRLVFHDIFLGAGGEPCYPVPWADAPGLSHLVRPDDVRALFVEIGFEVRAWVDRTEAGREFFAQAVTQRAAGCAPSLGTHLLMGETATTKLRNMQVNLEQGRLTLIQAVAVLTGV